MSYLNTAQGVSQLLVVVTGVALNAALGFRALVLGGLISFGMLILGLAELFFAGCEGGADGEVGEFWSDCIEGLYELLIVELDNLAVYAAAQKRVNFLFTEVAITYVKCAVLADESAQVNACVYGHFDECRADNGTETTECDWRALAMVDRGPLIPRLNKILGDIPPLRHHEHPYYNASVDMNRAARGLYEVEVNVNPLPVLDIRGTADCFPVVPYPPGVCESVQNLWNDLLKTYAEHNSTVGVEQLAALIGSAVVFGHTLSPRDVIGLDIESTLSDLVLIDNSDFDWRLIEHVSNPLPHGYCYVLLLKRSIAARIIRERTVPPFPTIPELIRVLNTAPLSSEYIKYKYRDGTLHVVRGFHEEDGYSPPMLPVVFVFMLKIGHLPST